MVWSDGRSVRRTGRLTRVNVGIDEKLRVDTVFAALAMAHPSRRAPESSSFTVAIVLGGL